MASPVQLPGVELVRGTPGYPERVQALSHAPGRLYVRGDPAALALPMLAVIGSRRPTPYGVAATELAVRVAVDAGVAVVSGGAVGCDQAAGWETIARGGIHVVVLGCGADVVYPRSSGELIEQVLEHGGAVVSLDPWGTPPRKYAFPRRNRVIAALAQAVFISEAGLPSGTFSTAETAVELGEEVLAVPGSIFSALSRGANQLIADGATCIADEEALEMAVSRIFGVLRRARGSAAGVAGLAPGEAELMRALCASPLTAEAIAAHMGVGPIESVQLVGSLMARGLVTQLVDGRYAASESALHDQTAFGHNGVM